MIFPLIIGIIIPHGKVILTTIIENSDLLLNLLDARPTVKICTWCIAGIIIIIIIITNLFTTIISNTIISTIMIMFFAIYYLPY